MKTIIRTLVFTIISIKITQYIINAFVFEGDQIKAFFVLVFAITLLYFFLRPLLLIVSLPTEGVGFLFLNFVLTLIIVQLMALFIPAFSIQDATVSDLIIFGFVLPSKDLNSLWAGVFASLLISLLYTFFDWMSSK